MAPKKDWTRLLGTSSSEHGWGVSTSADGSVYITGSTSGNLDGETNNGYVDAFISKFNGDGSKSWTKLIGTSSSEDGRSISTAADGSIYITGRAYYNLDGQDNAGEIDAFVSKFNSDGSKAWTRLLGSSLYDFARSVSTASDGSIYIAGHTSGNFEGLDNNGSEDAFISKLNSDGSKAWTKLLGTTLNERAYSISTSADGSIYVTGETTGNLDGQTNSGGSDAFISKFNSDGSKVWTKLLGSSGNESGSGVSSAVDGSIYITGQTTGNLHGQTNSGGSDAFISKFNSDGSQAWTKLLGSSGNESGIGVSTAADGSIYITGQTTGNLDEQTNGGGIDAFISKFNSDGSKAWTELLGSSDITTAKSVSTAADGSIYITGYTTGMEGQISSGSTDMFVTKFTSINSIPTETPTLQSTAATSNQLILTFSEDIQIAGGGSLNPAYMTVTVDGQTRKITRSQITAPDHPSIHTASKLALTLSGRSLDRASSISVSYNPPTNGSNLGFITDLTGNKLAAITSQAVDTFSTNTNINKNGIASAYKNLILTGTAPTTGYGNTQNNTITGNDANNILDGLAGADTMMGGLGDDTYIVDNIGDIVTELASAGIDTVQSSISYTLADNLENLTLLGSGAINGTGNTANNILTGNASANILNGNGGADTLIGGRGNDTYIVDSSDDTITETGTSSDVDSVQASVSWVLGLNLENLTLTGTSAINGTGNERDNAISGNSANNILDGGNGGTDRLTGLGGADTFRFSTRPTSFRDSSADHITDFSSAQGDKIQISKSAFGITASTATLSVVSSAAALTTALSTASLFVYNTANGELHWNQNGITRGAGSGGVLAILDNKATLSAGDLVLV